MPFGLIAILATTTVVGAVGTIYYQHRYAVMKDNEEYYRHRYNAGNYSASSYSYSYGSDWDDDDDD